MTGNPVGPPRWPYKGGLLKQPRKLFEACKLLRAEWPYVDRSEAKGDREHEGEARTDPKRERKR